MHPVVRSFPTPAEAAEACASLIAGALREADSAKRPYTFCLSGGPAWKAVYFLLAKQRGLPWNRAEFYWGDEAYVIHQSKDSNYRAARDILLVPLGIPNGAVHPIPTAAKDPEADARRYETLLRARWPQNAAPGFDVVLMGPQKAFAHEKDRWVGVSRITGEREPGAAAHEGPRIRLLLTPPSLGAARRKIEFEVGEDKAPSTVSILDASAKDRP